MFDTKSYCDAWANIHLTKGVGDIRPPLYPLLIGIFGTGRALTTLQGSALLLSMPAMWRTTTRLGISPWLCLASLATYAAFIMALQISIRIITEPLSIAGIILFIMLTTEAITGRSAAKALGASAVMTLLIFLRPAAITLMPIALVAWTIIFWRSRAKAALAGALSTLAVIAAVVAYSSVIYQRHGVFTPSLISVINSYTVTAGPKILDPALIQNPQSRARLTELYSATGADEWSDREMMWHSVWSIVDDNGYDNTNRAICQSVIRNPGRWLASLATRCGQIVLDNPINGILLLLTALYLPLAYWRHRHPGTAILVLYAILAVGTIEIIVGAPDSFSRLLAPYYPLAMILCMDLITPNRNRHLPPA